MCAAWHGVQIFREMLKAEVEGRPFSPPPPSSVPPPQRGGGGGGGGGHRSSPGNTASGSRNASNKNLEEWGNWDGEKVSNRQSGTIREAACTILYV